LSVPGSVSDYGRDLFRVRLVHRVARALNLRCVTLGALVVPALEIGINDLVVPGDDSPARLRFPGGSSQGRVEHAGRREHLRARLEFRLLGRSGANSLGKSAGSR